MTEQRPHSPLFSMVDHLIGRFGRGVETSRRSVGGPLGGPPRPAGPVHEVRSVVHLVRTNPVPCPTALDRLETDS